MDKVGSMIAEQQKAVKKGYKPNLYVASGIISLGGWLFGFDTGSIGPVTEMHDFYPLTASTQGVVVATILLTALVTSTASGPLSDKHSRTRIISVGASIFSVGSLICASCQSLAMFITGRAIAGLGEGLFLSVCGVWLIECAPKEVRGRMGAMLQLGVTLGVASGYFVCYGSVTLPSSWSFRIPYICQSAIAATLAILASTPLVPESPRWLLLRSAHPERAIPIIEAFAQNPNSAQVEKTELLIRTEAERQAREAEVEGKREKVLSWFGLGGVSECFRKREGTRWKTILGVTLMGIQQLSGIDAILFYAPVIFTSAGLSSKQGSFLASGITGIVGVVVTLPTQFFLMDRVGRRPSTIIGGSIMGAAMVIMGAVYASGSITKPAGKWLAIIMVYVFVAFFNATWAVVIKVYATEIQPNRTRAPASSLAQTMNWIINVAIALFTPSFLEKSAAGCYMFFGAWCFLGVALSFFTMTETKGLSMQAVDAAWDANAIKVSKLMHPVKTLLGYREHSNASAIELEVRH